MKEVTYLLRESIIVEKNKEKRISTALVNIKC